MSLHRAIAKHAPDLQHLIGVIPDLELAERALEESAENIAEGMFSEDEQSAAISDAEDEGEQKAREDIREDLFHILNDKEWETAEQLAKLVRNLADEL